MNTTRAPKSFSSQKSARKTYGREWLGLRDPEIRRRCAEQISVWAGIGFFCLGTCLFIAFLQACYADWLHFATCLGTCLPLYTLVRTTLGRIRQEILLPKYFEQRLLAAHAQIQDATRDFNAALPEPDYREKKLPEASSDSLPRLRVLLKEKSLTPELATKFTRLEDALVELEAAEREISKFSQP